MKDASRTGTSGRVLAFSGLLVAFAAALWFGVASKGAAPHPMSLPWPLLACAFALAEIFTVHIEFRQNAHTFSLNELPLVVALAFVDPAGVVLARVAGGMFALAVVRKQKGVKLFFNSSLFLVEATAALAIMFAFRSMLGTSDPARWVATFAATLGVNGLASLAITSVISLATGRRDAEALRRTMAAGAVTTAATTSLALVTAELITTNPLSLPLVVVVAAVMFFGYRGYAALHQRYANLQRLYEFTGALARSSELDAAVRSALTRARELMRAATAELYLLDGNGSEGVVVVSAGDDRLRTEPIARAADDWVWTSVVREARPVLLQRGVRDPAARRYLAAAGFHDLMMTPLVHGGEVIGALAVTDRLGEVSSFDDEDRKVFETLANHACISIQNSRLIDRLREEVASKQHQALHDMLTGLGNRRLFGERTEEALAVAEAGGKQVAVLLLDLNRFKDVNDSLGHHSGDLLLREVGARLQESAPPDATVCRLGGDEFAVLLPAIDDCRVAVEAARAIARSLARPISVQDLALGMSAAIGVAVAPEHGRDAAVLLRHADVAMYNAKESHAIEVYEATRDQASARRLALAVELREAIEQERLQVYFQPKASLTSGEPVGAEALLRWERPGHGFVSPDEFVPLAENVGLMRPLTMFVLRRALQHASRWESRLGVAVNLSARSIMDLSLPDDVDRILKETGFDPRLLTLEITEDQVVSDPSRTIVVLERLSALGVKLSIDDFGTGYSSLSYLQRLPVHEIKIDKSFVLNMATHTGNASIVRSVIDLARNLGLRVVAEGVEDQATWDALSELGCHVAQGYFLSRPVPPSEFMRWLQAQKPAEPTLWDNVTFLRSAAG